MMEVVRVRGRGKEEVKRKLDKLKGQESGQAPGYQAERANFKKRERERREHGSEQEMPGICCYSRTKKTNVLELADGPCIY